MNNYIDELFKLTKKAIKRKQVPVSCIIVKDNKIISKSYNKRYKNNSVMNHAEIIAIKKAARKLKDWRLDGCDLYVTLKPCSMCSEIIKASRIKNVYYLLEKSSNKKEFYKTNICLIDDIENQDKYKEELSNFFAVNCNR